MRLLLPASFVLALLVGCATTPRESADIHEQRVEIVRAKALNGNEEAIHDLCYRYVYGRNAKLDYAEALAWCTKGAEMGIDSSQTLLAEIYYSGYGVPIDYEAARRWYSAAADQGHEHALLMLYYIYKEGAGVPANQEIADRALKLAVDAKYGPALKVQASLDASR